jgi:hypothetical protein
MKRDPLEVLRRSRRNPLAPWGGAGTFKASSQKGTVLGPKDYGYWVSQGGTHFRNLGKIETLPGRRRPRSDGSTGQ